MMETEFRTPTGLGHVRAPAAVRGPYKDRFVNGQVAGVIRVFVPFRPSEAEAQGTTTGTS
jgi:hypothetical protein